MNETSNRGTWSTQTNRDEVARRASGRRAYNAVRRFRQAERRCLVAHLLAQTSGERGVQRRIARLVGVSEATISRDVAAILRE